MLRAIHFPEMDELRRQALPGSIHLQPQGRRGIWALWYRCPCGCGEIDRLSVGANFKPPTGPSWNWNTSTSEPSLTPSVNRKGHWHGWLRDGFWEAAT
jgi:hypothetical protein